MRMIDLSIAIETGVPSDPPKLMPQIEYLDHKQSIEAYLTTFPGLREDQLPNGEAWAGEFVHLGTHSGTHMDAPWHFASTMDHGKPARTIDQIPLEWCLQKGLKLDFRHLPDGYVVQPEDIDAELARVGATIEPLTIVLVNTSAGTAYGLPEYRERGCGMGRAATLHLLKQGVKIVGTDAWSWDVPFSFTRERFARDGDPSIVWEGHKAGLEGEYYQMEKLHNLEAIGSHGFLVGCFPIKIKAASAGWTRCVAILDSLA
jgi:kynurenine formamidase